MHKHLSQESIAACTAPVNKQSTANYLRDAKETQRQVDLKAQKDPSRQISDHQLIKKRIQKEVLPRKSVDCGHRSRSLCFPTVDHEGPSRRRQALLSRTRPRASSQVPSGCAGSGQTPSKGRIPVFVLSS